MKIYQIMEQKTPEKNTENTNDKTIPFAKIKARLNQDENKLPFGYYSPEMDGKLKWVCDYDQQNKIVSMFEYENGSEKDRVIGEHALLQEAIETRDQLIKAGWIKIKSPEITVKYADGMNKPMNREHKRYLAKQIKKMDKENPFDG